MKLIADNDLQDVSTQLPLTFNKNHLLSSGEKPETLKSLTRPVKKKGLLCHYHQMKEFHILLPIYVLTFLQRYTF